MGCKGSKHAWHGDRGGAALEPRRWSSGVVARSRHSVALRSLSTLGTLSLDRAATAMVSFAAGVKMSGGDHDGGRAGKRVEEEHAAKRCRRGPPPRTPTKTPLHEPDVINVWELMDGLEDDEWEEEAVDGYGVERRVKSAPGSPVFDPDVLAAFRKAVEELPPESPPRDDGAVAKEREIQMFPGVVRARVILFQKEIDAKLVKKAPPPPESARRVVLYFTSLRGIRHTYEDCCDTSAILRSHGVRVDERDLSLHAGYKDELRAALDAPGHVTPLPQVFVDGWHLGGADDVRRMHESGELSKALLSSCDMAAAAVGKAGSLASPEPCGGCGGVRFVPCDACSGSCKVFVEDEDCGGTAGAFRRCPECNENGLVRCPVC
ncbi:hypothetical protein ABZP36_021686 [Zizania latifolia]